MHADGGRDDIRPGTEQRGVEEDVKKKNNDREIAKAMEERKRKGKLGESKK